MWYRHDFSSEQETYTAEHEGILHVVEGNTSGPTQAALREMLQTDTAHGLPESIGQLYIFMMHPNSFLSFFSVALKFKFVFH